MTALRTRGVVAHWAAASLAVWGCAREAERVPGMECRANLQVRTADPDPLEPSGDNASAAAVTIVSQQQLVFDDLVTQWDAVGAFPLVTKGDVAVTADLAARLQVEVHVYEPHRSKPIVASGSTAPFACEQDGAQEVPLYLGPANGFARVAGDYADRRGATATVTGDRVFVVGGRGGDGAPTSPAVRIYDHATGQHCADDCFSSDDPLPDPRWDHTATSLHDGSILVVGGRDADGLRSDMHLYDAAQGAFRPLEATLARARHAAVSLHAPSGRQDEVSSAFVNKVAIFGGEDETGVVADVWLVDVVAQTVEPVSSALVAPRADIAAVFIPGDASVLLSGGRDAGGAPSAVAELFHARTEADIPAGSITPLLAPCVAEALQSGCAARAGHTATLTRGSDGDDAVVLWGGDVEPVDAGAAPPVAEVYVLWRKKLVPFAPEGDPLLGRTGHTTTELGCSIPPCPLLVVGGAPASPGGALPPRQLELGAQRVDGGEPVAFGGTAISLATPNAVDCQGHAVAVLPDRTVYITAGVDAAGTLPRNDALLLSLCRESPPAKADNAKCPQLGALP